MNILEEAESLIHGERQLQYSHPYYNFTTIGEFWGTAIRTILEKDGIAVPEGFALDPEDVALMMTLLKVARELANEKRDNLVDAAGYLGTIEMIQQERVKIEDSSAATEEPSFYVRHPLQPSKAL